MYMSLALRTCLIMLSKKLLQQCIKKTNSAQDNKIIDKWVQSISSGGMCINDTIMQVAVENLPFGGVGKFQFGL